MAVTLNERGVFTWKEWAERLATEIRRAQAAGDPDRGDTYYDHWLATLEKLVVEKRLLGPVELAARHEAWDRAARATPHGQPIVLGRETVDSLHPPERVAVESTSSAVQENKDRVRLLRDPEQIKLRRAELSRARVAPLAAFSESLRRRRYGKVPEFDPWDGGISARALFLFEKPGPKVFDSGFVSRNNDDRTAESTFKFMENAGIPRQLTCIWNVVPGWNGTIKLTSAELTQGAAALRELLLLLPDLRVVVLVGKRASNAWSRLDNPPRLPTIRSAHPSPVNYALSREAWDAIPSQWAMAKQFL